MSYKIVYKYGHCEVYIEGKFYCTADSEDEALREIEEYEEEHACVLI
jgi:hypothetical protein